MTSIRLLAIIEASVITGPAKNLLEFAVLARSDCALPVEVGVVTFRRPGNPDVFASAVQKADIPFFEIPERGRFDRSVIPALRDVVDKFQPDVLQSHAVKSHSIVRYAGLHHRLPWVAFHHGYTWPDLRARLYNQLDRWSLRATAQVLTVSNAFRDQLIGRGVPGDRIHVIHNAIDPDWGARLRTPRSVELRRQLGIPQAAKVVLTVGRLSKEKDHLTLLQAFAQVRSGNPDTQLIIIGEGPERMPIESRIRELGLSSNVVLTGQQASAEPYYAIADLAVISSISEGSPNALLEAMAARVPVVATAVGGIPEMVQDGDSALLVTARDLPALASAMTSVLANPEQGRRLANNAHSLVRERHSPSARVQRLAALYSGLLAHQGG